MAPTGPTPESFTEEHITLIAERTAKAAVKETFTALGVPMDNATEMSNSQQDFAFLRKQREGAEAIRRHGTRVAVAAVICGGLVIFWEGFLDAIQFVGRK